MLKAGKTANCILFTVLLFIASVAVYIGAVFIIKGLFRDICERE